MIIIISCVGKKRERSKNKSLQRLFSYILFINNFRAFFIICSLVTRLWTFVRVIFFSRWFCYERLCCFCYGPETSLQRACARAYCMCVLKARETARERLLRSALWDSWAQAGWSSDHRMLTTNPNALWDTSVHYIRVQKCSLYIRTLVQNGGAPF